jgi:hypothetical protein
MLPPCSFSGNDVSTVVKHLGGEHRISIDWFGANVRFGSLAAAARPSHDGRFTPETGFSRTSPTGSSTPSQHNVATRMSFLDQVRRQWRNLWRHRHIRHVIAIEEMAQLSGRLGKTVYLIGEPAKWVVLACPCGCGDRIDVNLMKSRSPVWTPQRANGQISLNPSLWMPREKCGSRFWLRNNRIVWTVDSP